MRYLPTSLRIPRRVHEAAMKIIQRVSNRIPKNWQPKTVEGSLTMHNSFDDINMSRGEWMILARTRYMLEELEEILKQKGLYFENRFNISFSVFADAGIFWNKSPYHPRYPAKTLNRTLSNVGFGTGLKTKIFEKELFLRVDVPFFIYDNESSEVNFQNWIFSFQRSI